MSSDLAMLQRKKMIRFRILRKIYDESGGNHHGIIDMRERWRDFCEMENEFDSAIEFLVGELLVKRVSMGDVFRITHSGIKEIESAIEYPEKESRYFPAVNIIRIDSVVNSQIQQGTKNSRQIHLGNSGELQDLESAFAKMLEALESNNRANSDQKELVQSYISLIVSQTSVPKPNRSSELIKKTWEQLEKLCTVLQLGEYASRIGPLLFRIFGTQA